MAGNTNIDILPGGRFFRYYFWTANRCAFSFFFKHLRVAAFRIPTGVSFHNFKAEYLKPLLHVLYLVLGFERNDSSTVAWLYP